MNAVLQSLLKLQALDFSPGTDKKTAAEMAELRAQIPAPILGHYDRLRVRGKKGVALVRNHTCTGCYMRQPIGKITTLMRDEDIQLCDTCGRYLYLPSEAEVQFVEKVEATKPAPKKTRKPKATLAAAASCTLGLACRFDEFPITLLSLCGARVQK